MAKGRNLTTTRSDLFFGTFANAHTHHHFDTPDPSELHEEDIWSTADDGGSNLSNGECDSHTENNGHTISIRSRHRISRDNYRQVGGLSLAFQDPSSDGTVVPAKRIVQQFRNENDDVSSPRGRPMAFSAPVNVPDWSKILRVDSVGSFNNGDDADFGENESEMVPPHEYLARSRNAAANSLFEGVGRTLKGRDMSRVREAVWSQTGFYG
ncbi:hypothetical protein Lal_00044035 [Lupinus albus]|uniref:Putative senescence regulator S40 n=1 Tax=Lupinus albus TaxID=3870 RepID=A0A6A4PAD8_LUPAL|nr:putative senescence regulator S40 [Lupinus albus]KAF1895385.1 hypothetical protein Lal_00044035 [Lupinus albus]